MLFICQKMGIARAKQTEGSMYWISMGVCLFTVLGEDPLSGTDIAAGEVRFHALAARLNSHSHLKTQSKHLHVI